MQLYLLVSIIKCVFLHFYIPNMILVLKNLENSHYGSMVGGSEGKLQLGKVVLSPVQNVLSFLKLKLDFHNIH